jgi:hypothetical protein
MFALPQHISSYLTAVLSELTNEDRLRARERGEFVERLAYYFAELTRSIRSGRATVVLSERSSVTSRPRRDTRSTGPAWTQLAISKPHAKATAAATSSWKSCLTG